jgi:hypothetical protein
MNPIELMDGWHYVLYRISIPVYPSLPLVEMLASNVYLHTQSNLTETHVNRKKGKRL